RQEVRRGRGLICTCAPQLLPFRYPSDRDKMGHQQLYWSHPRKFGQGSRSCRVCSNRHGLIRKYGLNMCRQCFRQYAKDIGFCKVRSILIIRSPVQR
ncbi:RS29 protein, partial [Amia calva]|nr:RS29 protein [Amia calva]